jgi:cell division protein ZapA
MAVVSLSINGHLYDVACDDQQADHVRGLAAQLDERAHELVGQIGPQPEGRVLLMLALSLADELIEQKVAASLAQTELGNINSAEKVMARSVADLAERIESIAIRMERS